MAYASAVKDGYGAGATVTNTLARMPYALPPAAFNFGLSDREAP
jgi:hypothetical protein